MKLKCTQYFILLPWILSSSAQASMVQVGAGSYTTDLPAGLNVPSDQNNKPVTPRVTDTFTGIPQTNHGWSSLIWKYDPVNPWSTGLFPYPFSGKATSLGLGLGYATHYSVSPYSTNDKGLRTHEYHYDYQEDLLVGVVGMSSPDTKVENYSDWTVTASWSGNGRSLKGTMGEGLPYAYFTLTGDQAQITITGTPQIWYNQAEVVGLTVNGHHYGVFGPSGSQWTTRQGLSSNLNGKTYFSIAVLPDSTPQTLEQFRQHAYAFVTGTKVSWSYDSASSRLTTHYSLQTELKETRTQLLNRPLVGLFRHQWLNSKVPLTSYTYTTPRGVMKVADVSEFTTQSQFNGILPVLPNVAVDGIDTYSSRALYQYVDRVFRQNPLERWSNITVADTYWTGKAFGKVVQLLRIAEQVKHTAAKDLFLSEIKSRLQEWLDGKHTQKFYYDSTWKTLIGSPASYGSDTQLNDHHFHYGYFIQAAAAVAQYDPAWASQTQYGGMIHLLIKDVDNWDRTDTRFPFLRYFDVYDGHGWANGSQLFGAGNNQESSSESMNFSSGLILWGAATHNSEIRDLGIYLYTTETQAIEQYWFDKDRQIFPPEFPEPTVGMVWGNGGAYSLWWNGSIEELHGINFLPITAGSVYLGRIPGYLKTNQDFMKSANSSTPDMWKDIHMAVQALYDAASAISEWNKNPNFAPEAGESTAHTYHWIHNLNSLGRLATSVTANIPTYNVFEKNGVRTYAAFNPKSETATVTFSDGKELIVPAGALATSADTSPPEDPYSFIASAVEQSDGSLKITFTPAQYSFFVDLNFNVNQAISFNRRMRFNDGKWTYSIYNLKAGAKVEYWFTYNTPLGARDSNHLEHEFVGAPGPNPSPSTQPSPSPSATPSPNPDFSQSVQRIGSNQLQIIFTPSPLKPAEFVDIHYFIGNQPQQNFRMTQQSNNWVTTLNGLNQGDLIKYWFTYFTNGAGYDSSIYSFTF